MKRISALWFVIVTMLIVPGCALTGSETPLVTHQVEGSYSDCRSCHEEGVNGAPKTDHARKDDCLSCHGAVSGE